MLSVSWYHRAQPGDHTGGRETPAGTSPCACWAVLRRKAAPKAQEGSRGVSYLLVEGDGLAEVAQQVLGVAKVSISTALSSSVPQLLHQGQVPPERNQGRTSVSHGPAGDTVRKLAQKGRRGSPGGGIFFPRPWAQVTGW